MGRTRRPRQSNELRLVAIGKLACIQSQTVAILISDHISLMLPRYCMVLGGELLCQNFILDGMGYEVARYRSLLVLTDILVRVIITLALADLSLI